MAKKSLLLVKTIHVNTFGGFPFFQIKFCMFCVLCAVCVVLTSCVLVSCPIRELEDPSLLVSHWKNNQTGNTDAGMEVKVGSPHSWKDKFTIKSLDSSLLTITSKES